MKKTSHSRKHLRVFRMIELWEYNPDNPALFQRSKEIKRPSATFCPIYKKPCRFPGCTVHLSCLNCFGRLAMKKPSEEVIVNEGDT